MIFLFALHKNTTKPNPINLFFLKSLYTLQYTIFYILILLFQGSRICGSCPSGYEGDGITCVFVGGCKINNGGCHPLAVCIDGPYGRVQCLCHSGYIGDGIVSCLPATNASIVSGACGSNPCIHGTCVSHDANKFSCNCQPGFVGWYESSKRIIAIIRI